MSSFVWHQRACDLLSMTNNVYRSHSQEEAHIFLNIKFSGIFKKFDLVFFFVEFSEINSTTKSGELRVIYRSLFTKNV